MKINGAEPCKNKTIKEAVSPCLLIVPSAPLTIFEVIA